MYAYISRRPELANKLQDYTWDLGYDSFFSEAAQNDMLD